MALSSNGYQASKVSPGLNMQHGFVRQIQERQQKRLHEEIIVEMNRDTAPKQINNTPKKQNPYELPGRGKQLFCVEKTEKSPREKKSPSNSSFLEDSGLTMEDIDLKSYMEEAQPFIKDALENPSNISGRQLQKVAEVIVNRAWEDHNYYDVAAKMCRVIFNKEIEQQADDIIPSNNFRNGVTLTCSLLIKDQEEFRQHSLEGFMLFVRFLAKAYSYLTVGGHGLQMLLWNIYDALYVLCSQESLANFELVELLHSTLHDVGSNLESENSDKMLELVNKIRDALLDQQTDDFSRGVLLEILELRASNWTLPPEVASYYIEFTAEA